MQPDPTELWPAEDVEEGPLSWELTRRQVREMHERWDRNPPLRAALAGLRGTFGR